MPVFPVAFSSEGGDAAERLGEFQNGLYRLEWEERWGRRDVESAQDAQYVDLLEGSVHASFAADHREQRFRSLEQRIWSSSVAVCSIWRPAPVCRAKEFQMRTLLVPMRHASRQCVTVRRVVTCKSPLLRRNSGSALCQARQAHQVRRSAQTRAANEVVAKCGSSVPCERHWRSCKQDDKA